MNPIELNQGNLYTYKGRIVDFGNGEFHLLREPLTWLPNNEDSFHTVKSGEMLDFIAHDQYKQYTDNAQSYWWVIADVNLIANPLDMSALVGVSILIPNILNVKLKIRQG